MQSRFGRANRGIGIAGQRPSITSPDTSPGDEYFAIDTGEYSKCTVTATGAKQWTTSALGAGIQRGSSQLVGGTKIVQNLTITATSTVLVQRTTLPGGGTPIGLLAVTGKAVGAGTGTFTVNAVAEANQAAVAGDSSQFDYLVLG